MRQTRQRSVAAWRAAYEGGEQAKRGIGGMLRKSSISVSKAASAWRE